MNLTPNERRDRAVRIRTLALKDLHEGRVSIADVLLRACTPEGEELLRIPLRQLLLALPDVGPARVRRILALLERNLGSPLPERSHLNVRWLIDARSRGARVVAFADSVLAVAPGLSFDSPGGRRDSPAMSRIRPPWDGFPFTPPPARMTSGLGERIHRPDQH